MRLYCVNKNIIYCNEVIFKVIFWKIAILSLGSNTFPLSTIKTVHVRGIHVRHCTCPCEISSTAAGGKIRLHASVGVHHWEVKGILHTQICIPWLFSLIINTCVISIHRSDAIDFGKSEVYREYMGLHPKNAPSVLTLKRKSLLLW